MIIEGLLRLTCIGLHNTSQCWIHRFRVGLPSGTLNRWLDILILQRL